MYGQTNTQGAQAKAGRRGRSRHGDSSLRPKQHRLPYPFRPSRKAPVRRCYAIQHEQQRSVVGLFSIHEREAWLEVIGRASEGKAGADFSRAYAGNCERPKTEQSKLVWLDMVGTRLSGRLGNISQKLATRRLCSMGSCSYGETKTCPPASRIEGKLLQAFAPEKRDALSVGRTNNPAFISVHRTRGHGCLSVHRIYHTAFGGVSLSVHRTPSRYATTYTLGEEA